MKRYFNEKENKVYYEGSSITFKSDRGLFSGIPSDEQLKEWGFVPLAEPQPVELSDDEKAERERLNRMARIRQQLSEMDYLTDKEIDGEDMQKYNDLYGGDWHEYRRNLRKEFNELEDQGKEGD